MWRSAVIFGRAAGVWDELAAAREMFEFDATIAVGSAGVDYPGWIDIWVSFHCELFEHWRRERALRGYTLVEACAFWSNIQPGHGPRSRLPVSRVLCEGGSSGLVACIVATEGLGIQKVVLAGIPMEEARGQYDTGKPWDEATNHQQFWEQNLHRIKGKVRSMSGWTQQLLGAPTPEWFYEQRFAQSKA
jgi:hypothetical protein